MLRKRLILSTAIWSGVAGCGEPVGTDGFPTPANLAFEPFVFEVHDGRRVDAELGLLWLPAADGSGSSTVGLRFVRLGALVEEPGPPIVYLAGGPGGSGIVTGRGDRFDYFNTLRREADVILLDQRGTGWSSPNTVCDGEFDIDPGATERTAQGTAMATRMRECAAALTGRGLDIADFNTERNAEDLEVLRRALGVDQLTIIGYSYGTHLALSYIRRYPERVARAVLHGVEGPDHTLKLPSNAQRALESVDSLVRADPRTAPLVPDLLGTLDSLLTALEASPETTQVDGVGVVIGTFDAQRIIWGALGDREDVEQLPAALLALSELGWSIVGPAVLEMRRSPLGLGMSYATDCASGASPERLAQIEAESSAGLLGDASTFPFPEVCAAWDAPDLGPAFRSPVTSDVPVLFVSGSIDGRTPESNAIEVAQGFPNGRLLLIENAGHNELATALPIRDAILDFLQGRGVPERVTLPNLRFATELDGN